MQGELNALSRLLHRLQRQGRKGAVVALALSLVFLIVGGLMFAASNPFNGGAVWMPGVMVFSLLLLAFGLMFAALGMRNLVVPPPVEPKVDRGEFLEMIGRMKKPLRVCTACRILVHEFAGRECPECLSGSDVFEVRSEADVRVVSAVIR